MPYRSNVSYLLIPKIIKVKLGDGLTIHIVGHFSRHYYNSNIMAVIIIYYCIPAYACNNQDARDFLY